MRERAIATIGVWLALLFSVLALVQSLVIQVSVPYIVGVTLNNGTLQTLNQVREQAQFVGGGWQFIVAGLIMALITGAALATAAIWRNAGQQNVVRRMFSRRSDTLKRAANALEDTSEDDFRAAEAERYARLNDDGRQIDRVQS